MKDWKKLINTANAKGHGIQIWNTGTNKPFANTQIFWVEILTDSDRIAGLVLKACATCFRNHDAFYDKNGNCSLREIPNERKILERSQGELIVQVITDCQSTPLRQEIYLHILAEECEATMGNNLGGNLGAREKGGKRRSKGKKGGKGESGRR